MLIGSNPLAELKRKGCSASGSNTGEKGSKLPGQPTRQRSRSCPGSQHGKGVEAARAANTAKGSKLPGQPTRQRGRSCPGSQHGKGVKAARAANTAKKSKLPGQPARQRSRSCPGSQQGKGVEAARAANKAKESKLPGQPTRQRSRSCPGSQQGKGAEAARAANKAKEPKLPGQRTRQRSRGCPGPEQPMTTRGTHRVALPTAVAARPCANPLPVPKPSGQPARQRVEAARAANGKEGNPSEWRSLRLWLPWAANVNARNQSGCALYGFGSSLSRILWQYQHWLKALARILCRCRNHRGSQHGKEGEPMPGCSSARQRSFGCPGQPTSRRETSPVALSTALAASPSRESSGGTGTGSSPSRESSSGAETIRTATKAKEVEAARAAMVKEGNHPVALSTALAARAADVKEGNHPVALSTALALRPRGNPLAVPALALRPRANPLPVPKPSGQPPRQKK